MHIHYDTINLKHTLQIDGLSFRRFRGAVDFPKMLAVFVASLEADEIEVSKTLEDFTNGYAHLENCDLAQDLIFAEIHGQVIGYLRGYWWKEVNMGLRYSHSGFIVPNWRRKRIGTAMLQWIENRLREVAIKHSAEVPKCFEACASQVQTGAIQLLKRSGYDPVRYFDKMVRPTLNDIPNFALPNGLSIRPAFPKHYRTLWKTLEETSRDFWGCPEFTEKFYQTWLSSRSHYQPDLWQIAWDDATNQIVGHVLTFIDQAENEKYQRQRGYTEWIGVCKPWRNQGVARALIASSLKAQKAEGMTESALGVDSANPSGANQLYEQCGFQSVKRNIVFNKPL